MAPASLDRQRRLAQTNSEHFVNNSTVTQGTCSNPKSAQTVLSVQVYTFGGRWVGCTGCATLVLTAAAGGPALGTTAQAVGWSPGLSRREARCSLAGAAHAMCRRVKPLDECSMHDAASEHGLDSDIDVVDEVTAPWHGTCQCIAGPGFALFPTGI